MAQVIWSDRAIADLENLTAYVAQFKPLAAQRLAAKLITAASTLEQFPERGRPTRRGLRDLLVVYPYLLRYALVGARVEIVTIRHGARRVED